MLRRSRLYNSFFLALLLTLSSVCSLLISHSTSAASIYDDVIKTTNNAIVKKDSTIIDLSNSWISVLADCNNNWYEDSVYVISCNQFKTNLQTALANGTGWFVSVDEVKTSYSIGGVSEFSPGDKYVKVGINTNNSNYGEFSGTGADARLNMKGSSFTNTCVASMYVQTNYNSRNHSNAQPTKPHVVGVRCDNGNDIFNSAAKSHDEPLYDRNVYLFNSPIDYPAGYEGDYVIGGEDTDGDGLNFAQESAQGTSDTTDHEDTDGDGLDDLAESIWNPGREDIFCKKTVTPYVCAYPDPLKKDVYVEVDWMNDGTTEYKPTSVQLSMVTDMFNDHDINLHFDVGEYGGGNELATYTSPLLNNATPSEIDYFDYKSGGDGVMANFSTERASIWHYMITGNKYTNDVLPSNSSGWASGVGSNIFIAVGRVKDILDTAWEDKGTSNTIAHEIGHNLCLTSTRLYNEQPAQCTYAGIDNDGGEPDFYDLTNYESVMNYHYQLRNDNGFGDVDYSDGSNVDDDHDDWAGIQSGLGKFNIPLTLYVEFGARNSQNSNTQMLDPEGKIIIE